MKVTINNKTWVMQKNMTDYQLWISQWYCDDGDGAELYIDKYRSGFELNCFSGIPASKIYVDVVDFGILWRKAFGEMSDGVKPIQNYTYTQQCVMLADWLCSIFCSYG